jgi:hypothetical protein
MADPRLCRAEGCRGWATGSGFCSGHDPDVQALAQAAKRVKERGLGLPELESLEAAKEWIAKAGLLLAAGKLKPAVARELRLTAQAWAQVHQGQLAAQEFEILKRRVEELEGRRMQWGG